MGVGDGFGPIVGKTVAFAVGVGLEPGGVPIVGGKLAPGAAKHALNSNGNSAANTLECVSLLSGCMSYPQGIGPSGQYTSTTTSTAPEEVPLRPSPESTTYLARYSYVLDTESVTRYWPPPPPTDDIDA